MIEEQPGIARPMLSRGESLPVGSDGGKDKPIRTTSFDTATLYQKQGSITMTNGMNIEWFSIYHYRKIKLFSLLEI